MGDTTGSLFKSMKAKLGMNSMKQKGHHQREGSNTSQGGVPDVVDETHRHSGQREGHRRDPRKYNLEKPSKSREIMMDAYKGMRFFARLVAEITRVESTGSFLCVK